MGMESAGEEGLFARAGSGWGGRDGSCGWGLGCRVGVLCSGLGVS